MARKKSATRRNKQFKSVDPFRKGKSTKGLGQDIGFVSKKFVTKYQNSLTITHVIANTCDFETQNRIQLWW